jgi:O-methyltransferase involved in polyketide biosynthesis
MNAEKARFAVDKLLGAQETLLIPLWARAVEAARPNPILCDPKAVEIVDSLDYDFRKFAGGVASQVGCCLRAKIIDGWIRRFLEEQPQGPVVEIGAGLDTRFERLDNAQVRWFDLDLPDAMEVRRRFFAETPRRSMMSGSVLEPGWMEPVKQAAQGPIALTAEGVLYYLDESQVKQLFATLADHFPGCRIAFDSFTPMALRYANRYDPVGRTSGRLVWAMDRPEVIESWDRRFRMEESIAIWDLPQYRVPYGDRLPWSLRMIHWAFPPARRAYRLNWLRLG